MILLLTYLLNLFDLCMTCYWYTLYGIEIEGNPIGRWLLATDLVWAVKIFGVGVALAVMGICIRKCPKLKWVAYIPLSVYAVLAVWHIIITIIII